MLLPSPGATALPAGLRLRVVDDLDALAGIRADWEAAPLERYDADPDFYAAFAASRPSFVRPHVVVVERRGAPEAMLVARVEDVELAAMVGYRALLRPRVRSITLVHGGVAGVTAETAPHIVAALRASLAAGAADVLSLPALRVGSPLHAAALAGIPALMRQPGGRRATHRRLALPGSYDEFLRSRSKSTRDGIKRYRKKLERELGSRLELRTYREPGDLDRIFADTEPVAAQTYQRGLGVALQDTPQQRALLEVGLRRGWFRAYVIYLDGRPVAFWPGSAYRGTFFIGTPGYDPAVAEYRIGNYLLMRMIEDFCADPEIQVVDYGFGDGEYKRRFSTEEWEEQDVLAHAPAARPLAISAARTAVGAGGEAVAAALERAGVLDEVKRRWRDRLAARA